MHTELSAMDDRPPYDNLSSASSDNIEGHFLGLSIGTRKKMAPERHSHKKGEKCIEENHDLPDISTLEQWNSLDRITFDDTESSEWGRSNSSSMSWFDESEQEATLKVKNMMDNIEKVLYGESHASIPRVVMDECQQWKMRYPHLRVMGSAIDANCVEPPQSHLGIVEKEFLITEKWRYGNSSDKNEARIPEEDKEEVYACHGTLEDKPLLSHEFQQAHQHEMDNESKMIQEALLDELTKHVWKEVVEPALKQVFEKLVKVRDEEISQLSLHEKGPSGEHRTASKRSSGKRDENRCTLPENMQPPLPLSARELSQQELDVSYIRNDRLECHRRHSDHVSLSSRKHRNRLAADKISEERDEGNGIEEYNTQLNTFNVVEDEMGVAFHKRILENNNLKRSVSSTIKAEEERVKFLSPRRVGSNQVVEELMPLEKLAAPIDPYSRIRNKNDRIKYSEQQPPQTKSRHVRFPAIDDYKSLTNKETSSSLHHGRSSSALPKLAPKSFRPTMSSYKTMQGGKAASLKAGMSSKYEMDSVEDKMETQYNKFSRSSNYSFVQTRIGATSKTKQEKQRNEKYHF